MSHYNALKAFKQLKQHSPSIFLLASDVKYIQEMLFHWQYLTIIAKKKHLKN